MHATHTIDRTPWGSGPWDTEPDREDFTHAGFPCLLLRNHMGCWCGYVGVSREHPAFTVEYDHMDDLVVVHGGLTYSAFCTPPICHETPESPETQHETSEDDSVWWLGFDTAHAGDFIPIAPWLRRNPIHLPFTSYAHRQTGRLLPHHRLLPKRQQLAEQVAAMRSADEHVQDKVW